MMTFIVSGQPKLGHESWPSSMDDKVLSEKLYSLQRGAKERTRLEVKFEKVRDKLITYYHFSKMKDVTSCPTDEEKEMNPTALGRKGSYFVMSIRIDGYYSTDFSNIYNLLKEMYDTYVNGKVLQKSNDGYLVYQIMKLEEANETWEIITSELKTRGENTFLKRIKSIPSNISINRSQTSDYFSVEDDEKDIENVLIQKGSVIILYPDEMRDRNERIKQPEVEPYDDYHTEERITQHKFDTLAKATEDVKELGSTTDDSLSPKKQNNSENDIYEGEHSPTILQKKTLNKRIWLPIVLIVSGIIEMWLCVSIINMKGKVNSLVKQIDTLIVQRDSSILDSPTLQNETDTVSDEIIASGNVVVNSDQEDNKVTFLNLNLSDGTDAESMKKGNSYVITALTGILGQRNQAKGTGTYSCNENEGLILNQDGNKCNITVLDDMSATRITLTYKYRFNNEEESQFRTINIE